MACLQGSGGRADRRRAPEVARWRRRGVPTTAHTRTYGVGDGESAGVATATARHTAIARRRRPRHRADHAAAVKQPTAVAATRVGSIGGRPDPPLNCWWRLRQAALGAALAVTTPRRRGVDGGA